MTLEETLKLVDKGFTADEIRALAAKEADETPKDNEAPEGAPEPAAPETPGVSPEVKELTETVKTLTETVKKMQEDNIKNARIGSGGVQPDPIKEKMDEFIKGL